MKKNFLFTLPSLQVTKFAPLLLQSPSHIPFFRTTTTTGITALVYKTASVLPSEARCVCQSRAPSLHASEHWCAACLALCVNCITTCRCQWGAASSHRFMVTITRCMTALAYKTASLLPFKHAVCGTPLHLRRMLLHVAALIALHSVLTATLLQVSKLHSLVRSTHASVMPSKYHACVSHCILNHALRA